MTWTSLPQTEASVGWLKDLFPIAGSLDWVGGRNHFRAWVNLETGSTLLVRGVGDFTEKGFISISLRAPGTSTPVALSLLVDNKYVDEADKFDGVAFDVRLAEAAAALASAIGVSD